MSRINFAVYSCYPKFKRYHDGSIAIQLVDAEDSCPVATATVCLIDSGYKPPEGHVAIKVWSENTGMDAALIAAGIIEPEVHALVPTGFVHAPVHKLTPYGKALANPEGV